jgi:hypothetical protein
MKLTTTTFVSVDGVMQGSARRTRTAAADCVDTSSYAERAGHCCILGSCVGSAYVEGQP